MVQSYLGEQMVKAPKLVPVLFAILALAGVGCGDSLATYPDSETRFEVTIPRDVYAPGDTVAATIRNISGVTQYFSFCNERLQRNDGGTTWTTVSPAPSACTLELRVLGVGQTVPYTYILPAGTPSGNYRVVVLPPSQSDGRPIIATPQFGVDAQL
jgi:hypothetical protein